MPDDPTTPEQPIEPSGVPPTEPIPVVPESSVPPLPPTTQMAATPPDPMGPTSPAPRWYENRAAVASMITVGLLGIFLLVGWLLWWSDDDETAIPTASTGTAVFVDGSTLPTITPTTFPPASVVDGTRASTIVGTLPPETTAPTTVPPTTPTTTPTTAATVPTTVPATDATTTVAPTTTSSIPVVSVPPSPSATLMDVLAVSPDLSRLEALVIEAGLDETLDGEDALTLFAPSNQAIETLEASPGGSELLADPDRLRDLLLGHVVADALDVATIFDGGDLTTAGGSVLVVDADAETVGGATLVVTDVDAANGVLHVTDRVFDEA